MTLDFTRAAELFLSSEKELAAALGITIADLREARTNPKRVTPELERKLARALMERGTAMKRVGEILLDDAGA